MRACLGPLHSPNAPRYIPVKSERRICGACRLALARFDPAMRARLAQ
jgi:hypothetical protein